MHPWGQHWGWRRSHGQDNLVLESLKLTPGAAWVSPLCVLAWSCIGAGEPFALTSSQTPQLLLCTVIWPWVIPLLAHMSMHRGSGGKLVAPLQRTVLHSYPGGGTIVSLGRMEDSVHIYMPFQGRSRQDHCFQAENGVGLLSYNTPKKTGIKPTQILS